MTEEYDDYFGGRTREIAGMISERIAENEREARPIPEKMIEAKKVVDSLREIFTEAEEVRFFSLRGFLRGAIKVDLKQIVQEEGEVTLNGENLQKLSELLKGVTTFSIIPIEGGIQIEVTLSGLYERPTKKEET